MIQVISTITEIYDTCLSLYMRLTGQIVGSHPTCRNITGKRMQTFIRNKMLYLETISMQICMVSHTLGIEISFCLYTSTAFGNDEVSSIVLAFHLNIALCANTIRYPDLFHQLRIQHGCDKIQIISMGIHIDISTQLIHIHRMIQPAIGMNIECCRQLDCQSGEADIIKVSFQ